MTTSLDTILSGRTDAPVQEVTQEPTTQATAETAEAEQTTEQQPEGQEGAEQPSKDGKQPPIGAIRAAEREKATKRYTEQVADFDKRLAETNAAWDRRFTQLLETVKPKAEPQPAPEIWDNPSAFVQQQLNGPLTEVRQVLLHNSRLIAEQRHTDDAVREADIAFTQAYQSGQIDPADVQRVLSSPNIYDAAVKWYRRVQAQQEIGDDPAAYKEKLRAELMAELQTQNGDGQQQAVQQDKPAQRVMPSNLATARNVGARSGPAWAGPTPLGDIFSRKR